MKTMIEYIMSVTLFSITFKIPFIFVLVTVNWFTILPEFS